MKTLIQIMIFPALFGLLLMFLFSQTSKLLEEPPLEEQILGVTHQRNETQNQKMIFFAPEVIGSRF